MHCEQATALIAAQIDHEISADDRALLDEHLRTCPACRATLEAFQLLDQDLEETFEPRRQAVLSLATQVNASLNTLPPTRVPRPPATWQSILILGAAAAVFAVGVLLLWRLHQAMPFTPAPTFHGDHDTQVSAANPDRLTPRPRQENPKVAKVKVGDVVTTRAGERRRLGLPDDSILFVNQQTTLHIDSDRQATLSAGSVFFEVTSKPAAEEATYVVKTPSREVKALGTRFAVQANKMGTEVLVTQGKVEVSGLDSPLEAGQLLPHGSAKPQSAPRSSHLLDWTRDLIAASESPLVPGSQYSGGALIAVDSSGQQANLSLRKFHVDVHIEDGFARTTIDQTYFNHHPWRLEGTFYFPLPPDASLSRLAMYVDGNLMEGGMAERDYARSVYEKIVRSQRDPALLEWVDGSTFKMRVFPLEGRQEKRIILSYSQRLSTLYGRTTYRFPAGHNLQLVRDWSFEARVKNAADWQAASPSHPTMTIRPEKNDLVLTERAQGVKIDQDVVLELNNPADVAQPGELARFSKAEHENASYLMLRFRPDLPGSMVPQRRDWVFLYESSADRDPLLARTQIEIVRTLLSQVGHEDTFNIVTASTINRLWSSERKPATAGNIQDALTWLDRTHLVGALDLDQGLRDAEAALAGAANPFLVHLGSGITAMGKPQGDLARTIPEKIHYVGIGVGKRWGRDLMKQAAERTGGYYTQINPDESVGWRTFDLLSTLNTPRLLGVTVEARMPQGNQDQPRFLVDNPSVAQGEEVCAITRLHHAAVAGWKTAVMPVALTVKGFVDGKPFQREIVVRDVADEAGYLPRTWAKLEIDRLLADNGNQQHKSRIIDLSKAMYVMTPFTSLLVLENEAMYAEFKVDRGRKDHWALYPCPQKIPVVYEPDPSQGIDVRNAPTDAKPNAQQVMNTILVRVPPDFVRREYNRQNQGPYVLTAFQATQGQRLEITEEELLTKLKKIISKQERVRMQTEQGLGDHTIFMRSPSLDTRLGNTQGTERMEEKYQNGVLGIDWDSPTGFLNGETALRDPERVQRNGSMGLDGTVFFAQHNLGFYLPPEQHKVVLGNSRIHSLSFSPDGRRLATGKQGWGQPWGDFSYQPQVRLWEEQAPPPMGMPPSLRQWGMDSAFTDLGSVVSSGINNRGELLFDRAIRWPDIQLIDSSRSMDEDRLSTGRSILRRETILGGRQETLGQSLLFQRLLYSGDERIFTDLLSYAPGLNSSSADIKTVVEAEAAPNLRTSPGKIAPEARQLIDRARQAGWQTLTLPAGDNSPEIRILFDGQGRYRYENTLLLGLHEQVICDGSTLWHLYPELGLAARRKVSRFHRAEMASLLPWLPLPAEDLARGADLLAVDTHTVAVVPHALKNAEDLESKETVSYRQHLVFEDEGRLIERQLVAVMGGKVKVLAREVHDGKGLRRLLDPEDKGKELFRDQARLSPAAAPELKPNLGNLVVLDLPLRSRSEVMTKLLLHPEQKLGDPINGCYQYLSPEKALPLLVSLTAEHSDEAELVFQHCFQERQQVRRGHFVLLAAGGIDLGKNQAFQETIAAGPADPLIRYLGLISSSTYRYLQERLPLHMSSGVDKEGTLLGELSRFRDLLLSCGQSRHLFVIHLVRPGQARRAFDFIRSRPHSPLALALLCYVPMQGRISAAGHLEIARLWERLAGPQKDYEASYEQARATLEAGRILEARALFVRLYERALGQKTLPPIDYAFRQALEDVGKPGDPWSKQMLKTAAYFIDNRSRPAVPLLADQVRKLHDQPLSDNLLGLALTGIKDEGERLHTCGAAIEMLTRFREETRAAKLARELLQTPRFANNPYLWRLASQLADRTGQTSEAIGCLERALDLEYRHLPDVINLETWREDYRRLLDHYRSLAGTATEATVAVPELIQKVVRAADRWRAHDPTEGSTPCELAAGILARLGQRTLAWEYKTTPIAYQHGEGTSPANMAAELSGNGEHELAEHAFVVALRANPTNGMLLWNRAMNLRQWGKVHEAREVLKPLAEDRDNDWPELRQRARWQLQQP